MMEHLTRNEANKFLNEVRRVLKKEGILRLVLPDLQYYARAYLDHQDADLFLKKTYLIYDASTFREKIKFLIYGRGIDYHQYMYDALSAKKMLNKHGFNDIKNLNPGESQLLEIEGIDLSARKQDNFYIECKK